MRKAILFFAILFAVPAFAQVTITTDCTINGNTANCTSTDNSASVAANAQQQKDIDESMNKLGTAIGNKIQNKIQNHKKSHFAHSPVTPPVVTASDTAQTYCWRNPTGSWNGVSCREAVKAAAPASEAAAPATTPVSSAASTPPKTEEQRDAASYCQRNQTATIKWSDGTVSPCSSVLSAR